MKNREILLELLRDMEEYAKFKNIKCPPIYLLGGSGCILGRYFERATIDIDLLDINYSSEVGKILKLLGNFDLLDMYFTTIPNDFKKRAVKLKEFRYLDIYVLSKEDIIVSKIARYSEKDKEDIGKLIKEADKNLVKKLINNVLNRENLTKNKKEFPHFNEVSGG